MIRVTDIKMRAVLPNDPFNPSNLCLSGIHVARTSQWHYVEHLVVEIEIPADGYYRKLKHQSTADNPIYTCEVHGIEPGCQNIRKHLVLRPNNPIGNGRFFYVNSENWMKGGKQ